MKKFLPTYCTMSFHDDGNKKTAKEAFDEGVQFAVKNCKSIRIPNKEKFFEAGIIATIVDHPTHFERDENDSVEPSHQ